MTDFIEALLTATAAGCVVLLIAYGLAELFDLGDE
jgi:hypothetical protein